MILAWISSRYECWDQSSFSLTHIETYGSTSIWLSQFTIPYILLILAWHSYIHFNLYLHTSSLIILMQSDFLDLYPCKQTNVENILYPLYIVSFVIWHLLGISSLMHSWLILQYLIKANPLSNSSCSHKASHLYETVSCLSTHVSLAIC